MLYLYLWCALYLKSLVFILLAVCEAGLLDCLAGAVDDDVEEIDTDLLFSGRLLAWVVLVTSTFRIDAESRPTMVADFFSKPINYTPFSIY